MKLLCPLILAAGLVLSLATGAQAQNFVETESWSLKFEAKKFNKVQPAGRGTTIYHWFLYKVSNEGKKPRKVKLNIYAMINRVRAGESRANVRHFNSFINFKLPAVPPGLKTEFDNMPKFNLLKRYYDDKFVGAMGAVQKSIRSFGHMKGPYRHTSDLGILGPGKSVFGVAVFKAIDKQMDFTGIMIKGLKNRIQIIADKPYIVDSVLMIKYQSPGDATNAFQNPIVHIGRDWVIMGRKKIRFPNQP